MMKVKRTIAVFAVSAALMFFCGAARAELKPIQLPAPKMEGGMPLMQALKERSTSREFGSEPLPEQTLSNLLWAAFGINRPESGRRTAPSAMNWQEVDMYVALPQGLYIYNASKHSLDPVLEEDVRAKTGMQKMAGEAPVSIVFVADFAKMKGLSSKDEKILFSAADAAYISQNIYLFCASEGLATGVRGAIDKPALANIMKLGKDQKIVLAQSVGFRKK